MVECVDRLLAKPPKDHAAAAALFGYFASRISEVRENSLAKLKSALILPVTRTRRARAGAKAGNCLSYISPLHTYLGKSTTYGDIFDFVDFGQEANAFLFHCGAKSEPTKLEVAHMLCSEPARMLDVLQSAERYLDLLSPSQNSRPLSNEIRICGDG